MDLKGIKNLNKISIIDKKRKQKKEKKKEEAPYKTLRYGTLLLYR
jgi:hypothetical protein